MGLKNKRAAKGAAVPHNKKTANLETVTMPLPEKIVLPMVQHIGAPCVPVVKKGDNVHVGSLIGEEQGAFSANIYSGLSGVVSSIDSLITSNGKTTLAVTINGDGQQTIEPSLVPPAVRDRETFVAAVRAAGLVGLGGAGFPTALKLSPPDPDKIDTLIINAAECEPYITSDDREMLECGNHILSGIMAVKKYLNIPKAYIAIERNKPDSMDLMFSLTKGDPSLSVFPLPTIYPQGAEKVLIETVCKREVPQGGLPSDVGVIVLNVTTVSAIGKYLATGMPLTTKRLTVDGSNVVEPKNVEVIIGTSVGDVLEFCGGLKKDPVKVIMGGPMMGIAIDSLDVPVTKQNNAIIAFDEVEAYLPHPGPCIRCGKCISACPVGLSPIETTEAYENRDFDMLEKLYCDICIMCGCCSYVCPAKRRVSQGTSLARAYYLNELAKKKKKRSDK